MSLPHAVSIKKDLGRLISHALPAKLTFDQACMREGHFSESYIHSAIHEIATANLSVADYWIQQNYAHPDLQDYHSARKKLGAPRAVDLFIAPTIGRTGSSLAIEVKWTPSDHCKWSTVLADIYRLKLVRMADHTTDGMVVLCGPKNDISRLMMKLRAESQKRAINRIYGPPLVVRDAVSKSGNSQFAPTDENGRFLGGAKVRDKLPLGANGKPRIPTTVHAQFLGQSTVGIREWSSVVWRIS
jgi:hypothetical protein